MPKILTRATLNRKMVKAAQDEYSRDGEIEVDKGAVVSYGDSDGAYVQAWVWVNFNDARVDDREARKLLALPNEGE